MISGQIVTFVCIRPMSAVI